VGCNDGTSDDTEDETFPAAKGKVTINGLSEHDGKYIWLSGAAGGKPLFGITDITGYADPEALAYKLVKISGGTAAVPLYTANPSATSYSDAFVAYDGNDGVTALTILIINDADGSLSTTEMETVTSSYAGMKMLLSGTFSSGNLTVDWSSL
jgi:hypothetical protein